MSQRFATTISALRFTLADELVHICMGQSALSDAEVAPPRRPQR